MNYLSQLVYNSYLDQVYTNMMKRNVNNQNRGCELPSTLSSNPSIVRLSSLLTHQQTFRSSFQLRDRFVITSFQFNYLVYMALQVFKKFQYLECILVILIEPMLHSFTPNYFPIVYASKL